MVAKAMVAKAMVAKAMVAKAMVARAMVDMCVMIILCLFGFSPRPVKRLVRVCTSCVWGKPQMARQVTSSSCQCLQDY